MSVAAFAIAAALLAMAFVIGVLSNWLSTLLPRLPLQYLIVGSLALAVASLAVGVAENWQSGPPAGSSPAPSVGSGAGNGLAAVAPYLLDQILLFTDESSGAPVMFAEHLYGTDRERLADFGGPVITIPGSANVLVKWLPVTASSCRSALRPGNSYVL